MPPFDFLKKNATTRSYPTDILIGELFVKAGVISQKQLDDTARSAGTKHLHIGQMLTMSGFINHRDLQSAVDAQSMLRDKVIDMNLAARCLKISVKSGANFQDLVKEELAIEQQASTQTNRLGELLMDSGIINKAVFGAAMQRSLATGLPLGRILVLNGSMPDSLLRVALELQVRVRDDMMARHEALEALKNEASKAGATLSGDQGLYADLKLKPTLQKTVRIGELLVMANFLNETDVMSCLELGLLGERQIGEVMVEQGYVSQQMLMVALTVQQMIEEGIFDRESAGVALKQMHETGQVLPEVEKRMAAETYVPPGSEPVVEQALESEFSQAAAMANAPAASDEGPSLESLLASVVGSSDKPVGGGKPSNTMSRLAALEAHYLAEETEHAKATEKEYGALGNSTGGKSFEDLLVASNVVTAADIDKALVMARENPLALADILKTTGFLTEIGRQASLDCNLLLEKGDFAMDNAAQVLDHCINQGRLRNLTFEQALVELGWTREVDQCAVPVVEEVPVPEAEPFNLQSKLFAVADALEAESLPAPSASAALVTPAPVEPVVADATPVTPQPAVETKSAQTSVVFTPDVPVEAAPLSADVPTTALASLLDSLDPQSNAEPPAEMKLSVAHPVESAPEGANNLLSLFGLSDDGSEIGENVDEKTALAASQAEALIASLAQIPDEAIATAEAEAEAARPESFQTTAVFRAIADAEVDKIADKAVAETSSLDSLLSKLEGAVKEAPAAATPAADVAPAASSATTGSNGHDLGIVNSEPLDSGVPGLDSLLSAAERSVNLSQPAASSGLLANDLSSNEFAAFNPTNLDDSIPPRPPSSFREELLKAEAASAAESKEPAAEQVKETAKEAEDEVDLRSLFSTLKAEPIKPAEPKVQPAAAEIVAPVVAPAAPAPTPVTAPVAATPTPAPAPAPVVIAAPAAAPVPATLSAPPPAPVKPAELAVAPAPAMPVAPAAEAKPSASSSRLSKMNEAEVAAAKASQISSMSSALTKMAEMHYEQENYPEAQRAYERILSWRQGELGSSHPEVVDDLNNLAGVMCVQGLFGQAEPLIARAINILENAEVPEPLKLAENLTSLAGLQFQQGVFDKAEPLLAQALVLREKELGADNPELADSLRDFAKLLKKLGKLEDAEKHYTRAKILLGRA